MAESSASRAHWGNRFAFIMAASGSAVGLGNIWKFPYITGVNGGGAFVLIYLLCIAAVGLPIFIAELYLGQKSQKSAVESFEVLHRKGTWWRLPGWMGLVAAFAILSFYSVVGGWVLDFELKSLFNEFAGQDDNAIRGAMGALFESPWRLIAWHSVFMILTVAIVAGGIKDGIERWVRILMPALFVILILLFVRVVFEPGFWKAVNFLFYPDVSRLTPAGILEAVGHSFFTLSLGMGAMITYGSYLQDREELVKTAATVAILDTVIALVSGVIIFSVVFTFDLDAGGGPSLMFQTLPMLFVKMQGGYLIANAFFILVGVAALTSAVSLLEVVISFFVDKGRDRVKTTIVIGTIIYLLGIPSALSMNVLEGYKLWGLTFFDVMDKLSSSFLLPLGGLLISVFYGWVLGPQAVAATVGKPVTHLATIGLLWSARVVAPLAVLGVFLNALGAFN